MITLDPEFVGSLAPEPKLTTAVDDKINISYARLPRLERLRVSGKADETEEADGDDDAEGGDAEEGTPRKLNKAEKEKKRMRGKNKSLKRYLRKQRKNVIDPKAVSLSLWPDVCLLTKFLGCCPREACQGEESS